MFKNFKLMAGFSMMMLLACGCTSMGSKAVRGQSPDAMYSQAAAQQQQQQQQGVNPAGFHHDMGIRGTHEEVRGLMYQGHHTSQTWGGDVTGAQGAGGAYCPPQGGNCPPQEGYCPPYGQQCRGGCRPGCPHHYHTYNVRTMKDPVYPDAQQPGGTVVYPYYTFKGPDCFFYKGE
jgi:hypothetical protein